MSIDTSSSSRAQASSPLQRQIAFAPTMPRTQPRPTRTATEAWLGRKSFYASTTNSSLRPSQACAAPEGRFGGGRSKLSRRLKRGAGVLWGAKGRQSPCRARPATPRTLPDTQNCPPMRLTKPQVAAPRPSMRSGEGAPPSHHHLVTRRLTCHRSVSRMHR